MLRRSIGITGSIHYLLFILKTMMEKELTNMFSGADILKHLVAQKLKRNLKVECHLSQIDISKGNKKL